MNAWLSMDLKSLTQYLDGDSAWFDDSRSKVSGVAVGTKAIATAWKDDWQTYDRSTTGLIADMDVTEVTEKRLGKWSLLCCHRKLTGKGNHPFKETAWVSLVFEEGAEGLKLVSSYAVRANNTNAPTRIPPTVATLATTRSSVSTRPSVSAMACPAHTRPMAMSASG